MYLELLHLQASGHGRADIHRAAFPDRYLCNRLKVNTRENESGSGVESTMPCNSIIDIGISTSEIPIPISGPEPLLCSPETRVMWRRERCLIWAPRCECRRLKLDKLGTCSISILVYNRRFKCPSQLLVIHFLVFDLRCYDFNSINTPIRSQGPFKFRHASVI